MYMFVRAMVFFFIQLNLIKKRHFSKISYEQFQEVGTSGAWLSILVICLFKVTYFVGTTSKHLLWMSNICWVSIWIAGEVFDQYLQHWNCLIYTGHRAATNFQRIRQLAQLCNSVFFIVTNMTTTWVKIGNFD